MIITKIIRIRYTIDQHLYNVNIVKCLTVALTRWVNTDTAVPFPIAIVFAIAIVIPTVFVIAIDLLNDNGESDSESDSQSDSERDHP